LPKTKYDAFTYLLFKQPIMYKILLSIFFMGTTLLTTAQDTTQPTGLMVGDKAPNITGKSFDLKKTLKDGAVIVLFYRGQWCPFCNKQLKNFNDSLQMLKDKGATVIAITPETEENSMKTIEKSKASFTIINDKKLKIAKAYKVNFAVDENTISKYKKYGIDFNKANGENGANLPVPATYIIGKDGTIKFVYFNPDYSKRVSVATLLEQL
jgi:peroxiredoxin